MTDRFGIVAGGVAQEDGVVAGVILGPHPGLVQNPDTRSRCGIVHRIDFRTRRREVQLAIRARSRASVPPRRFFRGTLCSDPGEAVMRWDEHGGPARLMGRAVTRAVEGARTGDLPGYESAVADLALLPPPQLGVLLGAVIRLLLEDQHAGGLDGDDIRAVLASCYQRMAAWLPPSSVAVEPMVAVISSALGIHEPGVTYVEIIGTPGSSRAQDWAGDPDVHSSVGGRGTRPAPIVVEPPTPAEYSRHATLLIADLLDAGAAPLGRYLDAAFGETARAETMEMP